MRVTIKKTKTKWIIVVDGVRKSTTIISEETGASTYAVRRGLGAASSNKERAEYIKDLYWRTKYGCRPEFKVYRRGNQRLASTCISSVIDLAPSTIHRRLQDWSKGLIDLDEAFHPDRRPDGEDSKRGNREANWGNLRGERECSDRLSKIHHIPGPTPIEKQIYGY